MNRPLNADNLDAELTDDGRVVMEPGYLAFLRSNGYSILDIKESHTVAREDSDKAHLVVKVTTRRYPDDHPDLDYVADKIDLWACDCWAYRSGSADVSEGASPEQSVACSHIKRVSKVENAKSDDSQETLL